MATVNIREQIMTRVVSAIQDITIANGYLHDLGDVSRAYEPSESLVPSKLPFAMVLDNGYENNIEHLTGGKSKVSFDVPVVGYTATQSSLNDFDADIKAALDKDHNLGGLVVSVLPTAQIERSTDITRSTGKFVRTFEITYIGNRSEGL